MAEPSTFDRLVLLVCLFALVLVLALAVTRIAGAAGLLALGTLVPGLAMLITAIGCFGRCPE